MPISYLTIFLDGIKYFYKIMFWIHWMEGRGLWWIGIGWKEGVHGGWIWKEGWIGKRWMDGMKL